MSAARSVPATASALSGVVLDSPAPGATSASRLPTQSRRVPGSTRPDLSAASEYVHFSQLAYKLARRIFPGPYTLVLPATRQVPKLVIDKKQRTCGIRITSHPVTQALVQGLGRPLLTSTAILPGAVMPCLDAGETLEAFGRIIDVLVDSESPGDEPSTVIEIVDDQVKVLREGVGPIEGIFED